MGTFRNELARFVRVSRARQGDKGQTGTLGSDTAWEELALKVDALSKRDHLISNVLLALVALIVLTSSGVAVIAASRGQESAAAIIGALAGLLSTGLLVLYRSIWREAQREAFVRAACMALGKEHPKALLNLLERMQEDLYGDRSPSRVSP